MDCQVTPRLARSMYRDYRLDAIFCGKKWDPQLYDRSTIADRALLIGRAEWIELSNAAERLFAETLRIEAELQRYANSQGPERFLPARAWRRLRRLPEPQSAGGARLMRFDFHPTADGWRLTEVNSDVPGGLNESSLFPRLWPAREASWGVPGNPGESYVRRVVEHFGLGAGARVGLIHATAYADDWQHMAYLQGLLADLGLEAVGVAPTNVELHDGQMSLAGARLDAALRFFPGDWLLFSRWGEPWFSRHPDTMSNPLHALFSQNKFFPVVCAELGIDLPAWQQYLPSTSRLALRDLLGTTDLLKPSFGRVGEDIARIADLKSARRLGLALSLLLGSGLWIKQRQFTPTNLGSATEPITACVGVYCVDGRVVGAYGRLTGERFIDMAAADSPLFIVH
jgi:hypothetical protein